MAWIGTRLLQRKCSDSVTQEADTEETTCHAPVVVDDRPTLMLLVPDASGRASYKTHPFREVAELQDFIEFWFQNHTEGLIAFWAMTHQPRADDRWPQAEPIVLIQDGDRDDVVYLFSFQDIEAALEFVREEVHWRLELARVSIYWAVTTEMHAAALRGGARTRIDIAPSSPPPVIVPEPPEHATESPAMTAAVDGLPEVVVAAGVPIDVTTPLVVLESETESPEPAQPPELEIPSLDVVRAESNGSRSGAHRQRKRNGRKRNRQSAPPEAVAAEARETPIIETPEPIHEEADVTPTKTTKPAQFETSEFGTNGYGPKRADMTLADIERQVQKVLEVKRWEQRDGPFEGFGSPPGKF